MLLESSGGLIRGPFEGIGLAQAVALLTAEDVLKLPSDLRCELIDGVLIQMSPQGGLHGRVSANAAYVLKRAELSGQGVALGEVGFILRCNPDTVRAPDAAFIRKDRIPAGGIPKSFWEIAPDLVAEVVSPFDTAAEIQSKVREWLEAGVRLVWVVYPDSRTVNVIRSPTERVTLSVDDLLEAGDVVPGFSCRVAELFD